MVSLAEIVEHVPGATMETDTVNSKRLLAEAQGSTEMDIVGVGASPKKLRRMVESSDEGQCLTE